MCIQKSYKRVCTWNERALPRVCRHCHVSASPRGRIHRQLYLSPTSLLSLHQATHAHLHAMARHGTLMPEGHDQRRVCSSTPWHAPDGDDERRVCNAGPDGCSPQSWASSDRLGQAPSAAPRCSDMVCDTVCDEYGRRFYCPTLAASNVVGLPPSVVPGQCAQTLMTRLGLHGRDAFDLSTLSPRTFSL